MVVMVVVPLPSLKAYKVNTAFEHAQPTRSTVQRACTAYKVNHAVGMHSKGSREKAVRARSSCQHAVMVLAWVHQSKVSPPPPP